MFNIEFLRVIRESEYKKIISRFPSGARVLEIGGGTGYQAKRLTEDGFLVDSIDIPESNYADHLEFPVQPYDGRSIPFPDKSFDVVFSSNVLEHVLDLSCLQSEMKRVLRDGAYCVHLMPSGAWRFWTNVAHYMEFCQRVFVLMPRLVPKGVSKQALADSLNVMRLIAGLARHYAIVPRHGETGSAVSEILSFSARHWVRHFSSHQFAITEVAPIDLFYTGHMVLGPRLSLSARQRLSRCLGSACVIYVVRPA